jgi:TrmH family RNA methyltransferase
MKGQSIWQGKQFIPGVVVIGNEGKGVSASIEKFASEVISIPKLGGAESLNAGVATGIILSHLLQPK